MGLNHVLGISNCSSPMWKFYPQQEFYTELKQLKIPIENDRKGKGKWFVVYVSQQHSWGVGGV